jgi:hypothetical protein
VQLLQVGGEVVYSLSVEELGVSARATSWMKPWYRSRWETSQSPFG